MSRFLKMTAVAIFGVAMGAIASQAVAAPPFPNLGASGDPMLQDARTFCYNRNTGVFLHWGPCRQRRAAPPRVYCKNRYTGQFLYWGACRN